MDIEASIEIEAPAQRVWEVMADVERWAEWTRSISSIRFLEQPPMRVGGKLRIRQPKLPPAVWEVVTLEPGRGFVWKAGGPGIHSLGSHYVEPLDNDRSRATLRLEQRGPVANLLQPFVEGMSRNYVEMEIQGLKRRSEDPGYSRP